MHSIQCGGMQVRGCKDSIFHAPWQAPHVVKMAISKCKSGLGSLWGGAFTPNSPPLATGLNMYSIHCNWELFSYYCKLVPGIASYY